jgi:hypothetical protein
MTRVLTINRRRCGIRRGCAVALSVVVLGSVVAEWSFASGPTSTVTRGHTVATATTSVNTGKGDGGENKEDDYQAQESPASPVLPGAVATVVVVIVTAAVITAVYELAYDASQHGCCADEIMVAVRCWAVSGSKLRRSGSRRIYIGREVFLFDAEQCKSAVFFYWFLV